MTNKFLFVLIVIFIQGGCSNGEIDSLKKELQESKKIINASDTEKKMLLSRITDLEKKLEDAEFDYENIKLQKTEINEWVGQTIKGYGPCIWAGGLFERPVPVEPVINGTPEILMRELNKRFQTENSPKAVLLKIKNGTAYVKVLDTNKLTQQMGTTGATNYINSIVYTLFSVKSIKCIDIDFKEGDHAFPVLVCPEKEGDES